METNKQNEIRNAYEHSAQVQCIPASIKKTTEHSEEDPLVVAPYCRVSTDNKDQLASYELQCQYYKEYVSKHPGWRLYDIYADEGISGTSVKKRTDFLRMIADCKAGKIDMIIVKNIARFARNVVDCVATVRMYSCYECPASKPEYLKRKSHEPQRLQAIGSLHDVAKQILDDEVVILLRQYGTTLAPGRMGDESRVPKWLLVLAADRIEELKNARTKQ